MQIKQKYKIGRNDKCPRGSGKKYKRCHGDISQPKVFPPKELINKKIEEHRTLEIQRQTQQGLGKPIISAKLNGSQRVVVGNSLYNDKWKTFHDFLYYSYLPSTMGYDWWKEELKKPLEKSHPLIKIYHETCHYRESFIKKNTEISSAPFTGAVATYMWLSYNLYLIAHNAQLQNKLIERLKNIDQFAGANYETYVAAIFIRAGFTLEFENESDKTTSHCEFTATHNKSGKKYSVEAKFRHRKNLITPNGSEGFKLGIRKPLHKALKKKALYPRVIFIDLDLPTSEIIKYSINDLVKELKKCEKDIIDGNSAPPAYVFLTNYPYHYEVNSTGNSPLYFLDGFKIPDFGNKETNLHEAIVSRKKHFPIHALWDSLKTHTVIPATFDGSIPEFTFSDCKGRLEIGQKYVVIDKNGSEQTVELLQANVVKSNKVAISLCKTDNGQVHIIQFPLTDQEMSAYKQSPDTFFGVYREQSKNIQNPIELFDFFMKSYHSLPKKELLIRLKNHPNYHELLQKDHNELLELYCENLASNPTFQYAKITTD